jgi:hypothetical protein
MPAMHLIAQWSLFSLSTAVPDYEVIRSNPKASAADVREALMEFFSATNGAKWSTNTGWGTDSDWCTWHGVNCDGGSRVCPIALNLPSNNLDGILPASLATLTDLNALILNDNAISGELPAALGSAPSLQVMWLSNNKISGSLPASLSNLKYMRYLFLEQNNLVGVEGSAAPGEGKLTSITCDLSGNPFACPIPAWTKDSCQATCGSMPPSPPPPPGN